jgi:hypothetical protein
MDYHAWCRYTPLLILSFVKAGYLDFILIDLKAKAKS